MLTNFFLLILCASSQVTSVTIKERKQCCDLGTNFASAKNDCKDFKPEWAGPRLANEKVCLSTIDVCCKKQIREAQCIQGSNDAMNGASCPSDDGDRKDCCESCQAGIDSARAKDPCTGLGLGSPYDDAFNKCCEEYSKFTPTSTSSSTSPQSVTKTTTIKSTTVSRPFTSFNDYNTPVENICDSDVCAQMCEPVGDSFKCDCYKGFVLMEDGISCRPEKRILKKGGRCEISNPCDHDCIDTGTAIKCSCREGYQLTLDNRTCKDVDECALNLHDCTSFEDCINEIGTYSCYDSILDNDTIDFENKCPPGFKYNFDKQVCDDIDECQFDLICSPPKTCQNTIGSFECVGGDSGPQCPPGFHYKAAIESCADIDECLNGKNDCNKESQFCLNTKGNYTCVDKASRNACPPGFKKNTITQQCDDINECEEEEDLCSDNETCVNEPGGHTCISSSNLNTKSTIKATRPTTTSTTTTSTTPSTTTQKIICPKGYSYAEETHQCIDVNECQVGLHECAVAERCDNTIGSYHCSRIFGCGTGYTLDASNGLCEDDDECLLGTHNCRELGPNFVCKNKLGSYRCEPIRQYYTPPSTSSTEKPYPQNPYPQNPYLQNPYPQKPYPQNPYSQNPSRNHNFNAYTERSYPPPNRYTTHTYPDLNEYTEKPYSSSEPQKPNYNAAAYTPPSQLTPVYEPPFVSKRAYSVGTESTPSSTPTTPRQAHPNYFPQPEPNITRTNNNINVAGTLFPIGRFTAFTTKSTTTSTTTLRPTPQYRPVSTDSGETLPYYSPKHITTDDDETLPYYSPKPTTVRFAPPPAPVRPSSPNNYYDIISGQLKKCLPGYRMNSRGLCEDINECESNPCQIYEKCINYNGKFECIPPIQCKIGFELNESGDACVDVNECSRGIHKCLTSQICKNYHGYYTCECPPGHHLNKMTNECEDLDECKMYRPCRWSSSYCVNLKGSFKCECKSGFHRKASNDCEDIDECVQTPELCQQNCVNVYGSYRCSCHPGFTLNSDNRTCTDIDECERFKDKRLCIGNCKNVPGSYVCECPPGYKLGSDSRVCVDVDECQANVCLSDEVCLNTRGGFKCYRINCPPNYIKDTEHKSRCKRVQSFCDPRDYQCLFMPEQYTYHYITLVSNLPLTQGHIDLFRIKGPNWHSSRAEFTLKLLDVVCPNSVQKVDDKYFRKVNDQFNSMALSLERSIQGPQEIKLQIEMRLFQGNTFVGNVVVYIIIVVSEFPF